MSAHPSPVTMTMSVKLNKPSFFSRIPLIEIPSANFPLITLVIMGSMIGIAISALNSLTLMLGLSLECPSRSITIFLSRSRKIVTFSPTYNSKSSCRDSARSVTWYRVLSIAVY